MHSDLLLMLLADARLPVAGHTQSNVLEGAVRHGLVGADVPDFVRMRLGTVVRIDAATAVVARVRCAAEGAAADLGSVDAAWAARTPSPALRAAARGQGRALLRLAERLWPAADALRAVRLVPAPSRMVVLGAVAACSGIEAAALARLVAYDDVQTVCSAALKLLPLDPAEVATWAHTALQELDVDALATCSTTDEIPAPSHPQIEAWAQSHALSTRRLFRA